MKDNLKENVTENKRKQKVVVTINKTYSLLKYEIQIDV